MLHYGDHSRVFNRIKGFSEVKLEKYYFFLGGLTLMYILKGPSKTVLYRPLFLETVLVAVNNLENDF